MKKRTVRFSLFFIMMLIFAIVEDIIAASLSGATLLIEAIPIIMVIAFTFTLLTELLEEHFEYGRQPLERVLDKTFSHMKKKKIKPTYSNIKRHAKRHY
jgi:hypothetical protein